MHSTIKVGGGVAALLCIIVWTTTTSRVLNVKGFQEGTNIDLPVKVKQLQAVGGIISVELSCGMASVTTPNRLNDFTCTLKNNTIKSITAANVAYSVVFEQAGKESRDTRFHTLATFIHPDFYEKAKSILPGGISVIRPGGSFTYENAVVTGVEVYIDYIEFEDNTSIGPNEKGAQFIKDMREGALKYKNWLIQKYKGKSIDTAIELLQSDQPFSEIQLSSFYQEQGAKLYRKRLRKINEVSGRKEVQRYLSK